MDALPNLFLKVSVELLDLRHKLFKIELNEYF